MQAFLTSNTSALHNFKCKFSEAESWEAVSQAVTRDLKGLDGFLADTIVMGNALALRKLMAEAVQQLQAVALPFAGGSVAMTKLAVKRGAYEGPLAFLAQESCGLMDGIDVDQSAKEAITALGGGEQLRHLDCSW